MASSLNPPCGIPDCGASTTIGDQPSFGRGYLDSNGFWEIPCYYCARAYEAKYPEEGPCCPNVVPPEACEECGGPCDLYVGQCLYTKSARNIAFALGVVAAYITGDRHHIFLRDILEDAGIIF